MTDRAPTAQQLMTDRATTPTDRHWVKVDRYLRSSFSLKVGAEFLIASDLPPLIRLWFCQLSLLEMESSTSKDYISISFCDFYDLYQMTAFPNTSPQLI